jgi:hypothetical protein
MDNQPPGPLWLHAGMARDIQAKSKPRADVTPFWLFSSILGCAIKLK